MTVEMPAEDLERLTYAAQREAVIDRALALLTRARSEHMTWADRIHWQNEVDEFFAEVRP